jgi:Caspase recruitment domain
LTGDARPLDDARLLRILRNSAILTDEIDQGGGLLMQMLAAGCISQRQKDFIACGLTSAEKNQRLIDLLQRMSVNDYDCFVDCLMSSGQQHIASLLTNDGGERTVMKL